MKFVAITECRISGFLITSFCLLLAKNGTFCGLKTQTSALNKENQYINVRVFAT
jgi:hypothetical protein